VKSKSNIVRWHCYIIQVGLHNVDKVGEDEREEAEKKFKEVAEAYEILSDENKKRMFDMGQDPNGNGMDDLGGFQFQQGGFGGFPFSNFGGGFHSGGFSNFHGGGFGGHGYSHNHNQRYYEHDEY
jgi:DnaJ-class molecular chaperone